MGISCKSGYFTLNTSTGTQAITGLGFQPKFIIFLGTSQTANNTQSDINQVIGFATSSTARKCVTYNAEDNLSTTDTQRAWFNYAFQMYEVASSSVLYRAELDSMDSNGFTIDITVAPGSAYRVAYFAVGGTDITNTAIGDFDLTDSTGSQSITGVGFQPDFLFCIGAGDDRSVGSRASDLELSVGFSSGSGEDGGLSVNEETDQATSDASTLQRNNNFLLSLDANGNIDIVASLTSFDTNGFTVNKSVANDVTRFHYLAVKGGEWHVNNFNAQSSTGNFNVTDTDFTPKGVFTISGCNPTATTSQSDLSIDFGCASSASDAINIGSFSEDNVGTSQCFNWNRPEKLYSNYDSSASIYGGINFVSFLSNGFTLNQTTAETSGVSEILYFAVGESTQIVTVTSITSDESFGNPLVLLAQEVSAGSITSDESFGTPQINLGIQVNSIVSSESFGEPFVIPEQFISVSSISSSESFGVLSLDFLINVNSITSDESFGTPFLNIEQIINVNSISSDEIFGTAQINQNLYISSISSSESFGNLSLDLTLLFSSLSSSESFGAPGLTLGLLVSSIISSESFGNPELDLNIILNSIPSSESFGLSEILTGINVGSIPSSESFGNPFVIREQFITPESIVSSESFGILNVSVPLFIDVESIDSDERFGNTDVNFGFFIESILSSESFGNTLLTLEVITESIESGESFGIPFINVEQTILLNSIPSSESFGVPFLSSEIIVGSILSSESFGYSQVNLNILVDSIGSNESFGIPFINVEQTVLSQSIPSSESFGTLQIDCTVPIDSIGSSESFGFPDVIYNVAVDSINSDESFGTPQIKYTTLVSSIPSSESFGTTQVDFTVFSGSISSSEAFGPLLLNINVNVNSIPSSESFGLINLSYPLFPAIESIPSSESFGFPNVFAGDKIYTSSITSSESFGEPYVIPEQFAIIIDGIPSSESFGVCTVSHEFVTTFQNQMEKDLNEGFFNIEEFAIPVTITYKDGYSHIVNAIFDNEYVTVDADAGVEVMSRMPVIWMQETKYKRQYNAGCKVCVQGVNYQVIEPQPDGTGLLVLVLHHDNKS